MIELKHLTKRYGKVAAVDDVTFTAQPGRVTGLLGPNGAGKSTAMRMMIGLTKPTAGTVRILGQPYHRLPTPTRLVGVMLDATAQHPGRTGRETLTLAALMAGVDASAVGETLERVGLTAQQAEKRVGHYSLGMKQRLGIAGALIGDPEVLVLDEPANGLDPAGIRWMRNLLRDVARGGGTVLLSSHLLHEVELTAQDLVMIGNGRVVAQGAKDDLLSHGAILVNSPDRGRLGEALKGVGWHPKTVSGGLVVNVDPEEVARLALSEGLLLTEIRNADTGGLEDLFLRVTANDSRRHGARGSDDPGMD